MTTSPETQPADAPTGNEKTGRPRVAMLVFNPCAPDHRVTKEAEYLASTGRAVRIFCLKKEGLPDFEVRNDVEYYRVGLDWRRTLRKKVFFWRR